MGQRKTCINLYIDGAQSRYRGQLGMAWYDDPFIVTAVAVVIIFAVGVVIYAMRKLGQKPQPKKPQKTERILYLITRLHRSESPKAFKQRRLLTQKMNCGCLI